MPPLRRRKGDIPALVSHFIEKYAKIYNKTVRMLGSGTLNALLAHDWPGNVRELENAIERAIVLCSNGGVVQGAGSCPQPQVAVSGHSMWPASATSLT